MRNLIILLISIATFIACTKQNTKQVSTIDSTLQVRVDSILQNKLSELGATVGQVIIMEVRTGEIKASVGSDSILQESGLVRTASLLAALETKAIKLSDTVDVGNGILAIGKDTLYDHNWHRGGYGKITVEQGFGIASNIANYKIVKKAFENGQAFAEALAKYGYQVKDTSLVYNPLGYGILTTPLQNLTFFNSIAKSNTAIKQALEYSVTDGLAKPAQSDKVKVAGATGTIQLSNGEYAVEFCGYFPADNPKYSIIVTINKKGLPASGGLMAGDVFRQIASILMTEKSSDVEGLLGFWATDTILKTNYKLVMLMDTLYRYVHTAQFSSSALEDNTEWMNKYRNQLCRYYKVNQLGTDTISDYAKADTVIEASRKLWKLDSDGSTAGLTISNGIERTRLIFQQYNEYVRLLELCETDGQKGLLKDEFKAWIDLNTLMSEIYSDCVYLRYWGGSITGPVRSAGILQILESHISMYQKDRSLLNDNFYLYKDNGVFMECAKNLLLDCCQSALKEYVYEDEKSESYKGLTTVAKQKVSTLPIVIGKWIKAHESWANETNELEERHEKNTSEVLVRLSILISSLR